MGWGPFVLTRNPRSEETQRLPPFVHLVILAALVLAIFLYGAGGTHRAIAAPAILASASVTTVLAIANSVHSRRTQGYVDIWHPSLFPALYISASFLAPTWVTFVMDQPVGSLAFNIPVSPLTPLLVSIASATFSIAASFPFRERQPKVENEPFRIGYAKTLSTAGFALLLASLAMAFMKLARGGVANYGVAQTTWSASDMLDVLLGMLPAIGVSLIFLSRSIRGLPIFQISTLTLLALIVVVAAGSGSRNPLLKAILPVLIYYTWTKRRHLLPATVGFGIALSMAAFVRYRSSALGGFDDRPTLEIILGDLAPVPFTLGAVANAVPDSHPYLLGSTMAAAAIRLLPSPVANALFGEPDGTGGPVFRTISGVTDPNYGTGFSLPAEGYLNFGFLGMISMMVAIGLLFPWLYAHRKGAGTLAILYPIIVASAPFAIRNDILGAGKTVVYPVIFTMILVATARSNGYLTKRRAAIKERQAQRRADLRYVASLKGHQLSRRYYG